MGSLWEEGEERVESKIPKVVGIRRNNKKFAAFHNILQ